MAAKKKAQTEDTTGRFELDGEVLEFDINTLTFGEAEELETYFDKPQHEIDFESARGALFLAYLAKKRQDPGITLDDIRPLKVSALKEAKPERPTGSATETSGSQS